MSYTEQQWERVACYLDGQPIELTEAEAALARELQGQEARIEPVLDLPVPSESVGRAMNRLHAAAASLARKLRLRRAVFTGYSLAAAAAILLATLGLWLNAPERTVPAPGKSQAVAYVPTDVLLDVVQIPEKNENFLAETDLLAGQIDLELAEVSIEITPSQPLDNRMDALDETIRQFWDETPGTQLIQL